MHGSCGCGEVQFELADKPMFVHCCHCRMCQRQSGTAFALNALIEADKVVRLQGAVETIEMPSSKPQGQRITRCAACRTALWSTYPGSGPRFFYVRVGALDNPDACGPDVHIFTESKQPWVRLPPDTPVFEQFYDRESVWPAASLRRRQVVLDQP